MPAEAPLFSPDTRGHLATATHGSSGRDGVSGPGSLNRSQRTAKDRPSRRTQPTTLPSVMNLGAKVPAPVVRSTLPAVTDAPGAATIESPKMDITTTPRQPASEVWRDFVLARHVADLAFVFERLVSPRPVERRALRRRASA